MRPQRINVLGVGVSAVNMAQALEVIDEWIAAGKGNYVCCRDVHGLVLCHNDDELRRIHAHAGLVTPDGMPLVWLGRHAGYACVDRVYGPDLMLALAERSLVKGYRHFFYGGAPEIPERLSCNLKTRFPDLNVVGCYSPPYRPLTEAEDATVTSMINEAQPNIVWIGLSTPKQEQWMMAHVNRLHGAVLIGVGAAFDFHAGVTRQAPRWIQRSGFEWLFRLAVEPKRLWRRYLKVVPLFAYYTALQKLGLKSYLIDDEDHSRLS